MNRTLIAIISLLQGLRGNIRKPSGLGSRTETWMLREKSSISASNVHNKIGNTRSEQRENLEVDTRTVVAILRL